ncbi:imidazolonepropionase [candidate division TA06 bacterium]|uniref:Imidazolonepropionase n=1 Tax=candidate division TA06 bacterium TaxID=2250710 RepID=A0A933MJX7_UNCT6|nr:imidazolonepropionase [candidate division TA06 bacterium]
MHFIIQHIGQLLTLTSPRPSLNALGEGGRARAGSNMSELDIIEDGLVAIEDDKIVAVGKTSELKPKLKLLPHTKVIDAEKQVVMPGFVDCHTHLVYGGSREDEFEMRASGVSYQEIAAKGGGIRSTVKATRKASQEELTRQARQRLNRMLLWGTTTVEAKSGYGLDTKNEIKQLEVVKDLNELQAIEVVPTFMGAHEFPEEYRSINNGQGTINRAGYVDLICNEMIPKIAEQKLAEFCDVFCDQGLFTPEEAIKILETASNYGMYPKIHADELASVGAAETAGKVKAISAEHLLYSSQTGLELMKQAGTIAVLLPGTSLTIKKSYAPARQMIELGIPVALATDHNPGSCTIENMPFIIGLACLYLGLTPAEAICAATYNAACALNRGDRIGSIEVGKQADLLILDIPNYRYLPYHYGVNYVKTVVKKGRIVVGQ